MIKRKTSAVWGSLVWSVYRLGKRTKRRKLKLPKCPICKINMNYVKTMVEVDGSKLGLSHFPQQRAETWIEPQRDLVLSHPFTLIIAPFRLTMALHERQGVIGERKQI